eukprot:TRINITY_DN18168_c0_g1_i4.p1 TRINITY_DN18168_c0_g1~~TRINITY_DN18168_c0_g1_i4.p1  ORF type:complete len:226 (+),score=24.43 TRINITY_DN18168_c0_g1_i4:52-678(+)
MDQRADDAYTQEQSRLHCTSFWLHDGSSLRADRISKKAESSIARGSLADKGTSLHLQSRGSASSTSTVPYARGLSGDSPRTGAQMCGYSCFVRKLKPARLGCAIVELTSASMREEVMALAQQQSIVNGVPRMEIQGVFVHVRRHVDNYRTTYRREVLSSIFISWSHWVEKHAPLPLRAIVDAFDALVAHIEAPQPDAIPSTNLPNCSC